MNKTFVALGILLTVAGLFLAYFTGLGIEHNFTALKIFSSISNFLMIAGFFAVGAFLVFTGVKKS